MNAKIESSWQFAGQVPLDYYLQWQWPEHIETPIRRLIWVSLVEVAQDSDARDLHTAYVNTLIAAYAQAPAILLDYLSHLDNPEMLVQIAKNPQTPAAALTRLAKHSDAGVREAINERVCKAKKQTGSITKMTGDQFKNKKSAQSKKLA